LSVFVFSHGQDQRRPQLAAALESVRKAKAPVIVAKLDRLSRDVHFISQRTKEALASAKARGKLLGGLRDHGREAKMAAVERAKALAPLFDELEGKSAREIARILNDRSVATPTGKPWSAMTVIRARDRLTAAL
jgi:DNA invertase Pin-like site-specific DNA recombinase